jgi:hypothetical protein
MWDLLGELVGLILQMTLEDYERFYSCFLLSLAGASLTWCLVPGKWLPISLGVTILILGSGIGWLWERHSGNW